MIQQFHFWVYIQKKASRNSHRYAPVYAYAVQKQRYSQEPKGRSNPKVHQQMNRQNVIYLYMIEYYSALKSSEILIHATTWMNPEDIMLREIN